MYNTVPVQYHTRVLALARVAAASSPFARGGRIYSSFTTYIQQPHTRHLFDCCCSWLNLHSRLPSSSCPSHPPPCTWSDCSACARQNFGWLNYSSSRLLDSYHSTRATTHNTTRSLRTTSTRPGLLPPERLILPSNHPLPSSLRGRSPASRPACPSHPTCPCMLSRCSPPA